ncbi:MAG: MFS transporter [Bacteroidetes bacterium]|nr:MFS transporter [Bacteroidota bacterium]MCW5896946.1 MFS transporter [Bacteroidota bacterium]
MNPWRGIGDLPKQMWLMSFAVFINRAGMMVLPFLVLYLNRTIGYTVKEAGFVVASYGIAALVTASFAGKLSDRFGPLQVMRYSLGLSGLLLFLLPLAHTFAAIVVAVVVWSAISEAFRPAALAFIADITPPEQRKAAFALNRLAINLGMSIGPAVGGFLFVVSYRALFWADGLTALAASALLFMPSWKPFLTTHHAARQATAQAKATLPAFKDMRLLFFLLASLPVLVIFFQHEAAVPLFLVRDLHLPESDFGLMFTINTVLIILLEVPLNLATAHRPHREMLSIGAVLVGVGFGAMVFISEFWGLAATVVVWTFGEMIFLPTSATYMSEIAPAERRGEYMGLYQMMFSLAFALSALVGTAILDQFGATTLWTATLVAGLVSAGMMWGVKGE